MTRSMTGFGRATGSVDGETYTIELSSVNHRFFDCTVRLPSAWILLEGTLRECVRAELSRGKIYVSVRRDRGPGTTPVVYFDAEVAQKYIDSSRELARLMGTGESLSLNTLAQLEGVFYQEEQEQDLESVKDALCEALHRAVEKLNETRAREGLALANDIQERIAAMRSATQTVMARLPELSAAYAARLRDRLAELAADTAIKEERIAMEAALLAEKSDVNEEIVRLESHFGRVEQLLESNKPVGRELNFLAQEIQREANTLGSKIRDVDVVAKIVEIKSELEKLREQVQNIE